MNNDVPLVIFDGNCQGQHLSAILTSSGMADCYAIGQDLGFLPSHLGQPCRYLDEHAALDMVRKAKSDGRPVIQGSQSTPTSDFQNLSYTGLVDKVIRYPHLQFYSVSPEESQSRFGPRATPRRVFDMDLSVIEICQKRSNTNVDFAGWIRSNAASKPLFHTALHPAGDLTAMAVRSFAMQLPFTDDIAINQIEAYFKQAEGINSSTYHPIANSVLGALNFDWGEDYQIYVRMLTQRAQGSWSELVASEKLYREKFGHDTWCWLSLAQGYRALGCRIDAENCFLQLLNMSPGNLHTWLIGFEIYQTFNNMDAIQALMHKAACFFRGQRIFSQVMAFFMLNLGNAEKAAPYAWDYHARTPDRGDALLPIMLVLKHLGRVNDIQQIVDYELANAGEGRLAEIRAVLGGVPDLVPFLSDT